MRPERRYRFGAPYGPQLPVEGKAESSFVWATVVTGKWLIRTLLISLVGIIPGFSGYAVPLVTSSLLVDNGTIGANFRLSPIEDDTPVISTNGDKTIPNKAGKGSAFVEVSASVSCNCLTTKPIGVRSDGKPLTAEYPVGKTVITWITRDTNGNPKAKTTQTITVVDNEPPVISTNGNRTFTYTKGKCGVVFDAFALATDNCSVKQPVGIRSDGKPLRAEYYAGTTTISWDVTDSNGNRASTVVQTITVVDAEMPTISTSGDKTLANNAGQCGAVAEVFALATDNCSAGQPIAVRSDGQPLTAEYPVGVTTITWNVKDINGNPAPSVTQTVTVTNAAPVISQITAPDAPVKIGTLVNVRANFTDNNLQSAIWYWGNGASSAGVIAGSTVQGSYKYTTAGVYSVTVVLTDKCGKTASQVHDYMVVYDASADFTTGGGSVHSPVGAYVTDPAQAGPAKFGFVSRFQKGAVVPSGVTEFQFRTDWFTFKSTAVQSGLGTQLKGTGKLNNTGDYGFTLTAVDGHVRGGSGMDKFRLKIWDKVSLNTIYDSKIEAADSYDIANDVAMAITSGSIMAQRNGQSSRRASDVTPSLSAEGIVFGNYPNPFTAKTALEFSLPQGGDYSLHILDMKGSVVRLLQQGKAQAGVLYRAIWEVADAPAGLYIGRLTTDQGIRSIELLVQ